MEKINFPPKRQLLFQSTAAAPPSPVPTASGSRSAADPILSEYLDNSIRIPDLKLPQNVRGFKPDEIGYGSIVSRDGDSVRRLLRSIREFGVVQICDHGILTEELRSVLGNSDRVFGLMVECCTSYGDHEKIVWRGDFGGIAEEATAAIGDRNYQIFRQKIEDVARQLEGIAKELSRVIAQSGSTKQFEDETIELGEPTLSIYRYHRANIIDRNSSLTQQQTNQRQSSTYALSLHLLLDSSELCLQSTWPDSSFHTKPDTIVVTTGKDLQEWRVGELKWGEGELMVKPFLQASRASFSIEQKWTPSNLKIDKLISLSDQILILLAILFMYNSFARIFS